MKKFIKNNLSLFIKICFILFFILLIVIFAILKTNPNICESWTRTFTKFYVGTLGYVFKYIPFSLTEFILLTIIILSIIFLVLFVVKLVKKDKKKAFHKLANIGLIVSSIFCLYFVTAELAYSRSPVPITLYSEKVDKSEFRTIVDFFLTDFNNCADSLELDENGEVKNFYSINELNEIASKEYERLTDDYFNSFTTNSKPLLSSFLFSEFHITGITIIPTTEANINNQMPNTEKPFTILHEIAHSKGIMREEDAQLVAAYLSLTSSNPIFRYSGYIHTFSSAMNLLNYTGIEDEYSEVSKTISNNYRKNISYSSKFWSEHNKLKEIANFFNNIYLKISGESKGTESYDDTPTHVDPTTREITSFSTYQKLYFEIYYNEINKNN